MRVALFGATSGIAQAVGKLYAARGATIALVGRNEVKLHAVKQDLVARGAGRVEVVISSLTDTEQHQSLISQIIATLGGLDLALIAFGSLPDQKAAQGQYAVAAEAFHTNLLAPVSLLTHLAERFESARAGKIAVISSVAGDRGRQSNYVYGAAKGGLSVFLAGLRNRLAPAGIQVLTIKPGFVDTPMTAHLPKGPLFASPETVAAGIVKALDTGRNVVYLPWFWQVIMTIICAIPEMIFKRLKL